MAGLGFRRRIALEAFRLIQNNRVREHELRTLFWECTLRCNLSCRHCGSDCRAQSHVPDMPMADFLAVVDQITPHVNPNKTLITIAGGEALVRDDIEQCGRYLYDRGFAWGIVTNGMLLDRKRLDSLLAAGLRTLALSIDGFAEQHNHIRRNDCSYDRAIEAAKMLAHEPQVVWDVVTCVTPKNIDSLASFRDHLIDIGVTRWRLFTIFPVGRATNDPELQLSKDQFVQLMEFIVHTRQAGLIGLNYACQGFLSRYEGLVRDTIYHCSAGVNTASVLVDGSISGCTSIRSKFHQGNIYQHNFMDVWNNRFQQYRDRSWAKTDQCKNCKIFRYCMGAGMHLRDDQQQLLMCHYQELL